MSRADRVTGAMVGCAAGDALGAPFEFGPAGAVHGIAAIPHRWRDAVFVPLPGFPGRPRTAEDLSRLALGLD